MEWQQLQKQAEHYQLQLLEAEKLQKKIEVTDHLIAHAKRETERYQLEIKTARNQLNKLESFSFINLFRGWSGKKDELIEQNMDRVAVSELKLIESQLTYNDLQKDYVSLLEKLSAVNEVYAEQQLKQVNEQKKRWIQKNAPHVAVKLTNIIDQELLCKQLIKEINEAIEAGKQALETLADAGVSLQDAQTYSTWDTFLGGGFMTTALKHEKLDVSNSYLHEAQMAIQRFHNELLDVNEMRHDTLIIDTDGFVKFTDFFFDNIFTDWSIHSKITTSLNQISRVQDDISNTIQELEQKLTISRRKEAELILEKEGILTINDQTLFFEK